MVQIQRDINVVDEATAVVEKVSKPKPKRSKRSNGEGSFYVDKRGYLKGKFSNPNKTNGRCEHSGKTKAAITEKHQKKCVDSLVLNSNAKDNLADIFYEVFEQKKKLRVRPYTSKTLATYYFCWKKLEPFFKNYRLKDLDKDLIKTWQMYVSKSHKSFPTTTARFLRTVLSAMVEYDYIKESPMSHGAFKGIFHRGNRTEINIFNDEDLEKLLHATENYSCGRCNKVHKHRITAGIKIQAALGLRISEAAALTWGDINFEEKTITISQQIDIFTKKRTELKGDANAYRGRRTLFIGENFFQYLINLKRTGGKGNGCGPGSYERKLTSTDYIMQGNSELPVDQDNFRKSFKRILKQAGLPIELHPHNLRHTFATNALMAGVPPVRVAYEMGHNIETLLKDYTHVIEKLTAPDKTASFRNDRIFLAK